MDDVKTETVRESLRKQISVALERGDFLWMVKIGSPTHQAIDAAAADDELMAELSGRLEKASHSVGMWATPTHSPLTKRILADERS